MSTLIDDSPDAEAWVEQTLLAQPGVSALGKVKQAVIWTDEKGPDGLVVGGDDPSALIDEINDQGMPLLRGHDPGAPVGRVIAARLFAHPSRGKYVAAILVLYEDDKKLSFRGLNLDPFPSAASPAALDALDPGTCLEFAADPREVDAQWVRELTTETTLTIKPVELSHNAAESASELIRVTLPYVALVWNPLVKTIATEAGKDIYAAIHKWIGHLWKKLSNRKNPIVVLQSYQNGCAVSFIFRGKDVGLLYQAHEALTLAAAQGAVMISSMKNGGYIPTSLVYEFQDARWFPSYATLDNGQIVSDRSLLIALEQLPKHLSLGVRKQEEVN